MQAWPRPAGSSTGTGPGQRQDAWAFWRSAATFWRRAPDNTLPRVSSTFSCTSLIRCCRAGATLPGSFGTLAGSQLAAGSISAEARAQDREALARTSKIAPELLTSLVQRADMARVNGIGAVFGRILEELGIRDVGALAAQEPQALHAQARQHSRAERLARRSPTPEEVTSWVEQARSLPKLVTY
jgi:predicted flap endonuclease-1-like 5' DNA nuclease